MLEVLADGGDSIGFCVLYCGRARGKDEGVTR